MLFLREQEVLKRFFTSKTSSAARPPHRTTMVPCPAGGSRTAKQDMLPATKTRSCKAKGSLKPRNVECRRVRNKGTCQRLEKSHFSWPQ